MLVLPAPVGPTRATVCPGCASSEMSHSTGSSGLYAKWTCSNATRPWIGGSSIAPGASVTSGLVSTKSKMRSAPAIADWNWVHREEIIWIGR